MPSMTTTFWSFGLIRIGTSPPNEKWENSITDAARMVATPASTALPPRCSILRPASTESGCPPATAPRLPRTTGRNVSALDLCGTLAKMKQVIRQTANSLLHDNDENSGNERMAAGPPLCGFKLANCQLDLSASQYGLVKVKVWQHAPRTPEVLSVCAVYMVCGSFTPERQR